jgi:DNA-binding transcriptional regulator YdaS (Cro superfamily)
METPKTRTMRRAAETLGDEKRLAHALGVAPDDVMRWVQGDALPGTSAFLAALDIVARGPSDLWTR